MKRVSRFSSSSVLGKTMSYRIHDGGGVGEKWKKKRFGNEDPDSVFKFAGLFTFHMTEGEGTAALSYVHSSPAKIKDRGRLALEGKTYASVAGGRIKMQGPTKNHLLQATAIERGPAVMVSRTHDSGKCKCLPDNNISCVERGRMVFAGSPYQQLELC